MSIQDASRGDGTSLTLSVAAAASLAGLSLGTMYESIRRNEIPVCRIGRRILVQRKAFERMLSGQ